MTDHGKPGSWGGRRPGAGRKPRPDGKKESRRVSLSPDQWAQIDAAQEALGLTRTATFEAMAELWIAANSEDDKMSHKT